MNDLVQCVMDCPLAYTESSVRHLVNEFPFLEQQGNSFSILPEINIRRYLKDKGNHPSHQWDFNLTWDMVEEALQAGMSNSLSLSTFNIQNAIALGLEWCFTIVRRSKEVGLNGLPAFWDITENGLEPHKDIQAGTCNSDALCALCESLSSPVKISLSDDKHELLGELIQYNLNCLVTSETNNTYPADVLEWNLGGFLPMDDQPNSYHPTVEATANFIIAGSMVYQHYNELEEDKIPLGKEAFGEKLLQALDFLLRMKLPDGAWGIYRYKDDPGLTQPNAFSTSLAVIAFGLLKKSNVFIDQGKGLKKLEKKVNEILKETLNFLFKKAMKVNGTLFWGTNFNIDFNKRDEDALGATLYCTKALFSLLSSLPREEPKIRPIIEHFTKDIVYNWDAQYKSVYYYYFNAPRKTELDKSTFSWEFKYDVRLAGFILELFNSKIIPPGTTDSRHKLLDNIEKTIIHLLKDQHPGLGNWQDPINNRPFVVSTLFALETLQEYLKAVSLSLDR